MLHRKSIGYFHFCSKQCFWIYWHFVVYIFFTVNFHGIVFLWIMISIKFWICWYIICWVSKILIFGPTGAWLKYPPFWFFGICRSYICTSLCKSHFFQMTQLNNKSEIVPTLIKHFPDNYKRHSSHLQVSIWHWVVPVKVYLTIYESLKNSYFKKGFCTMKNKRF